MLAVILGTCVALTAATSGKGNSKEIYLLHLKQFEEAINDTVNVRPYIIDLFQYHVPNADAFSHQREHANNNKEFMQCFGELSPHTEHMWRTMKKHWGIKDDDDWLIIKAVKGTRLLLCLTMDYFQEYKTQASEWYTNIKNDIGNSEVSNECAKQTGKYVSEMVEDLSQIYMYDSQKKALRVSFSIANYFCNINDKDPKFKDIQTSDIALILGSINNVLSEFGQRLKEEILDATNEIESYDGCKTFAEDMALNYGFDETSQKYVFLRKYHVVALMEHLYELQCEEQFGKPEL